MNFRAFAGAAALVRAAPTIRAFSNIARSARRIPLRPSPIVISQRYTSHMTMEQLAPAPGRKYRRRVGRGIGSRRGGHTSGRGHKGAKARGSGNPYRGFEGGQTPFIKKIPKRGFKNPSRKEYKILSIARIQEWISKGKYDPSETLTINKVISTKMIRHLSPKYNGIKLVMPVNPHLPLPPLTLHLSRFTESAGETVVANGGNCLAVYHNRLGLWQEIHPDKFQHGRRVKNAGPTKRRDIEYYTNPAKYGYLADEEVKQAFFRERGWDQEIRRSKYGGAVRTDVVPGSLPPKNPFPPGSITFAS